MKKLPSTFLANASRKNPSRILREGSSYFPQNIAVGLLVLSLSNGLTEGKSPLYVQLEQILVQSGFLL